MHLLSFLWGDEHVTETFSSAFTRLRPELSLSNCLYTIRSPAGYVLSLADPSALPAEIRELKRRRD